MLTIKMSNFTLTLMIESSSNIQNSLEGTERVCTLHNKTNEKFEILTLLRFEM